MGQVNGRWPFWTPYPHLWDPSNEYIGRNPLPFISCETVPLQTCCFAWKQKQTNSENSPCPVWHSAIHMLFSCNEVTHCACRKFVTRLWHCAVDVLCVGVPLYDSKYAVNIVPTNIPLNYSTTWADNICHNVVSQVLLTDNFLCGSVIILVIAEDWRSYGFCESGSRLLQQSNPHCVGHRPWNSLPSDIMHVIQPIQTVTRYIFIWLWDYIAVWTIFNCAGLKYPCLFVCSKNNGIYSNVSAYSSFVM